VRVIVDAADYFDLMQQAMLKARQRVLLIGWDFDTRIHLTHGRRWWQKGRRHIYPSRLGSFIPWLARHRRALDIRILKWGVGALKMGFAGRMTLDLLRWMPHPRIGFKFDNAHPLGCSHHQKIAVIDDRLAVCGGIDMADRRWDTREHREIDPRRRRPHGKPYGPWHDVTMMMEGDLAVELDLLARERWQRAGGHPLPRLTSAAQSAWPDSLEATFTDVEVGISRTRAEYGDCPAVTEVEQLYLAQIARAKRFVYSENQYFTSRKIAEAISARLAEEDPPEFVLVQPFSADGWLEEQAMDPARDLLLQAIREIDTKGRFHLYTPYTGKTPIYVHAKLTIVDDQILRVGSANLNNRSMGLDSECDVFIDCARPGNAHACDAIRDLRHSLLAEHCGIAQADVASLLDQAGSMAGMIAAMGGIAGSGQGIGRRLIPYQPREPEGLAAELADRQMLDPEHPDAMLEITPARRGLFRPGSLLARAMTRLKRKRGGQK
jgi:phosphatidylserine/phosphatidylglycerophosphate/cardiolipin synthase-like enzyme